MAFPLPDGDSRDLRDAVGDPTPVDRERHGRVPCIRDEPGEAASGVAGSRVWIDAVVIAADRALVRLGRLARGRAVAGGRAALSWRAGLDDVALFVDHAVQIARARAAASGWRGACRVAERRAAGVVKNSTPGRVRAPGRKLGRQQKR